jgi:hypothetical protein
VQHTGTFNIAVGEGFYIDPITDWREVSFNPVIISARSNIAVTNILTQPVTYICVDKDDNIIQLSNYPTPNEYRDYIFLGVVVHSDNVNVNVVNNEVLPAVGIGSQLFDHMNSVGFMNIGGNIISANGANLSINKSAGIVFKTGANYHVDPKDPHRVTLPSQGAPSNLRYRLSDSTEYPNTSMLDPDQYESSPGVLSAVTNNDWSIQRFYIFPSGIIRLMYGQEQYQSKSKVINAIGKEPFTVESNIAENGLLIGLLAIRQGATDLSDSSDAIFYNATKFGEIGSQGSSSVGDLQDAYANSTNPEIETVNGSVDFRAGQLDTDKVITVENGATTEVFGVTGEGDVNANGLTVTGVDNEIRQEDGAGYRFSRLNSATLREDVSLTDVSVFNSYNATSSYENYNSLSGSLGWSSSGSAGNSPSWNWSMKNPNDTEELKLNIYDNNSEINLFTGSGANELEMRMYSGGGRVYSIFSGTNFELTNNGTDSQLSLSGSGAGEIASLDSRFGLTIGAGGFDVTGDGDITGDLDVTQDIFGRATRVTGVINTTGVTGWGLESIANEAGNFCRVIAIDRGGVGVVPLILDGRPTELHHNSVEKLATTETGIDITGDLDVTGSVTADDGIQVTTGNTSPSVIRRTSASFAPLTSIQESTGLILSLHNGGGEVARVENDGTLNTDGDLDVTGTVTSDSNIYSTKTGSSSSLDTITTTIDGYHSSERLGSLQSDSQSWRNTGIAVVSGRMDMNPRFSSQDHKNSFVITADIKDDFVPSSNVGGQVGFWVKDEGANTMSKVGRVNDDGIFGTELHADNGFTGTGSYTSFTIVDGIITSAS